MTKKKILLTLRIGGENGGPYISHSRIMQSALKDKYDMKPLMVPRSRVLLDPRGMKSFVNTIKSENPDLVVVTGLQIEGFLTMISTVPASSAPGAVVVITNLLFSASATVSAKNSPGESILQASYC